MTNWKEEKNVCRLAQRLAIRIEGLRLLHIDSFRSCVLFCPGLIMSGHLVRMNRCFSPRELEVESAQSARAMWTCIDASRQQAQTPWWQGLKIKQPALIAWGQLGRHDFGNLFCVPVKARVLRKKRYVQYWPHSHVMRCPHFGAILPVCDTSANLQTSKTSNLHTVAQHEAVPPRQLK